MSILRQVEFYFGDTNLPYDKFLYTKTTENDGWVDLDVILNFKRMQKYTDKPAVVSALRESKELLEVSEDGTKVRRKTELKPPSEEQLEDQRNRTVYAKNFESTDFEKIQEFFDKFGPTTQIRMRRNPDGSFKKSVYAEFEDLETAKKFVEESHTFEEQPIIVMSKQQYIEMKSAENDFKDKPKQRKPFFNAFKLAKKGGKRGGNQRGRGRNFRKDRRSQDTQVVKNDDEAAKSSESGADGAASEASEGKRAAETESESAAKRAKSE